MDSCDACFAKTDGLFLSDEAQGAADFNAHLIVNLLHDIDDFLEFIRIILISSARYQRETDSARILGFLGSGQNLVLRQKTVSRSSRPVMTGLRAEFAVLLAVSAARIDDGAEVNSIAVVLLTDLICHSQKQHGIFILCTDQTACFFSSDLSPVQHFVGQADDFLTRAFHM